MISIFHGTNAETHDAFQLWRETHPEGFNMTEKAKGTFVIHWTQDKRENAQGRGCHHQGGSGNRYGKDKGSCYTTARKVCSESLAELLNWSAEQSSRAKSCAHCDKRKFPFPSVREEFEA